MNPPKNAAARARRREVILNYVRGSLMIAGSFAGVGVVLALLT